MTTSNLFVRLKRMLPDPVVLIGRVLELHDDDDTSTVQLLYPNALGAYDGTLSTGATIRARGQTVPVGSNAFVRNGVIETRAPDGEPLDIVVGRAVVPPDTLTFAPPIDDQLVPEDDPDFALDLASHWAGGVAPLRYTLVGGSLPAGVTLDMVSGVLSGPPSGVFDSPLTVRATDAAATSVDSNAFAFVIDAPVPTGTILALARGEGNLANSGTLGGSWTVSHDAAATTARAKVGTGSIAIPPHGSRSSYATFPNVVFTNAGLAITNDATPRSIGGWFYFQGACSGFGLEWRDGGGGDFTRSYRVNANSSASSAGLLFWVDDSPITVIPQPTGVWFHLLVARDAVGVVRMFVNGIEVASTTVPGGHTRTAGALANARVVGAVDDGLDVGGGNEGSGTVFFDQLYVQTGQVYDADFTPPGPF